MSLTKVVNRKQVKALSREQINAKRVEIVENFRQYILSQVEELTEIFPSVVIAEGEFDSNIVGVSYSPSIWTGSKAHTISGSTHNICLSSTHPEFHIGYGANTASGRPFKFDYSMTKPQLKRLYKQMLEYLVSESYWTGYKNDREHQVWKGRERLI
jgi:hypothetical protein